MPSGSFRGTNQGTRVRAIFKLSKLKTGYGEIKMATEKVTAANFNEVVLKSTTPVLVDFWAEWCGPCRAVAPILEEISNEYAGKIKVVKLNTDEEGPVASKYGISSIPTMNLFVGGEVVKSIVGARPKPAIVRELSEYLG